ASNVAVSRDPHEQYEDGEAQLPATMLAEIAELFKVPLFYFFQDLPLESPTTEHEEPTAVLTVATPADRAPQIAPRRWSQISRNWNGRSSSISLCWRRRSCESARSNSDYRVPCVRSKAS